MDYVNYARGGENIVHMLGECKAECRAVGHRRD
jgi:hypothetical protein